jgi:hypothetical protein
MWQMDGVKEIVLTGGGLTDVVQPRSKACREKSAEAIVPSGMVLGKG